MDSTASNQILDISLKDQSLWLVKIPQFVAEKWATMENEDILGSFSVTASSSQPNKKQLSIKLNNDHISSTSPSSPFPTEFSLEEIGKDAKGGDDFYALTTTETTEGEPKFSFDGKITKNLLLKPKDTSTYHEFLRDRKEKTRLKNRKETMLADSRDIHRASLQPQVIDLVTSEREEMKKKRRMDNQNLLPAFTPDTAGGLVTSISYVRNRIFNAFAVNEKQSLKDILALCHAGATAAKVTFRDEEVRETLKEYARYNSKGMFKSFWELKPEFRDHSSSSSSKQKLG